MAQSIRIRSSRACFLRASKLPILHHPMCLPPIPVRKGQLPFAFILVLIARPVHSLRFVILPGCSLILRNPALTSTLRYCCEGSRHLTPI